MLTLQCQQSTTLFLFNATKFAGGVFVGDWRLCRKVCPIFVEFCMSGCYSPFCCLLGSSRLLFFALFFIPCSFATEACVNFKTLEFCLYHKLSGKSHGAVCSRDRSFVGNSVSTVF